VASEFKSRPGWKARPTLIATCPGESDLAPFFVSDEIGRTETPLGSGYRLLPLQIAPLASELLHAETETGFPQWGQKICAATMNAPQIMKSSNKRNLPRDTEMTSSRH
jgi:hypothetical protein